MPFKSEKQRRYLWATRPALAREWADKYPTPKDLPMYVSDSKKKKQDSAEEVKTAAQPVFCADEINRDILNIFGLPATAAGFVKKADSKQEKIDMPTTDGPVYAGQTESNSSESEGCDETGAKPDTGSENAINMLLQKLSVVLSPALAKVMAEQNAAQTGSEAPYTPKNVGLKQYNPAANLITPPMGSTPQQPAQPQAPAPQTQPAAASRSPNPVGGRSTSPSMNPIQSFGALSMDGNINGNAAFGAKNSPDSSKVAAAIMKWANGVDTQVALPPAPQKQPMAQAISGMSKQVPGMLNMTRSTGVNPINIVPRIEHGIKVRNDNFPSNWETTQTLMDGLPYPYPAPSTKSGAAIMKWAKTDTPCSCGCGDTVKTCKCSADCTCRKPGGSCYKGEKTASKPGLWANIHAKRKRGEKPAKPGDKDYPDAKSWKKTTKSSTSSPAWQRAAGKNDEGGLNAKGRASYNRATGGNLKAPVTESNPKGERKSRRASFCARMGGMKKKLTGKDTARDPDSRINKALRKWNCKSGAYAFGKQAAKRVLNLSPSWGGGKYQLGEMLLNPQIGYRYLGGVIPTPDIGLRLGGFLGGNTIGLAPLPYLETDWGRPSGWQANKETRSLYKWLGDGMRDRTTASHHALANLPEDAAPEEIERVLRNQGVGYSSRELKNLSRRFASNPAARGLLAEIDGEKSAASPLAGQSMISALLRQNKTDQTVNRAASLLSPAVLNTLGKRLGLGVGPALSFGASLGHAGVGHGLTTQQKMLQQFQPPQVNK